MDDAKLPPPRPHRMAIAMKCQNGVAVSCTAKPSQIAGTSSEAVEIAVQRRPPKTGTMNE